MAFTKLGNMEINHILLVLQAYIEKLISKIYNTIGYTAKAGEDSLTKITREDVTRWACRIGMSDCRQNARADFTAFQNTNKE